MQPLASVIDARKAIEYDLSDLFVSYLELKRKNNKIYFKKKRESSVEEGAPGVSSVYR